MKLPIFELEEYLGKWEFKAPYLFGSSDAESFSLTEILEMADPEGLKLWENLRLGYTEVAGLPALIEEIKKLYAHPNSNFLSFCGAEEGIYSTFHTLLSPDDHVLVVSPCYQSLESIPASLGCTVSRISLRAENQWGLDLNEVEDKISSKTKLMVINFPHNPTGTLLDLQTLQSLIQILRKREIYLFSDEVYRFMAVDPTNEVPPVSDLYEKGVSLGVMSKAFGLAGLRIGWIATQDAPLISRMEHMKHYLSICNSAPSEALAFIALRAKEQILKRNQNIIRSNLSLLDTFFHDHQKHLEWVRPKGGCTAFPKLLIDEPIERFSAKLIHEKGVLILPGIVYQNSQNHFRIGFGRKTMPKALELFSEFLSSNP